QLRLAEGIGHVAQDAAAIAAVRSGFARLADPVALAAAQVLVTLAGSALIPLMLIDGAMEAEAAFDAASVDEDWNTQLWGEDAEALERRAYRRNEFLAAAGLVAALS
ncbi:MAG TPA: ATPase, partial [Beijerinckiaceae bacterium]|nr:ATPase [Beijerinckiaceae bacterium]